MLLAISAHDIDTAGHPVDAPLPVPWLDAELADASLTAAAPGRITGRLSRTGDDIVVRARVRAALTLPCARCMNPTPLDIDAELSLLLRPAAPAPKAGKGKDAKAPSHGGIPARDQSPARQHEKQAAKHKPKPDEEYEFTSEEADTDTYDGETVVLDPFVREAILLEVPNFPLCADSCPGIAPAPEATGDPGPAPLDPRLAPLLAVRAALNGTSGPHPEGGPSRGPSSAQKTKKKE